MKFQVREGFVIHDTRMVDNGGKTVEQTNSYYEGNTVDFDETTTLAHLHKLEPQDKAASAFCAARFAPVSVAPVGGVDPALLAALIAQAVTAAVAAMQTPAPAPAKAPAA